MSRTKLLGLAVCLSALALFAAQVGDAGSNTSPLGATDILLAFDTTSSMGPSIAAAEHDAQQILSLVGEFSPNAHFAVASFRDRFYAGGEYSLLTPMTSDRAKVVAALGRLKPVSSSNPANTPAEAYNLLFHQSYTDTHVGWRAAARKIVVVIGDAEPHGAGTDGLEGCKDRTADWDKLDTAAELAGMRAAGRTLVMIRQAQTATVSLACYATLASRAFEGGAARDGGSSAIAAPVLSLVKLAYAPISVSPQLTHAVGGRTDGLTVRIVNPNTFALGVDHVSVQLPAGASFVRGTTSGTLPAPTVDGSTLTWALSGPLPPRRVLAGHLVLRLAAAVHGSVVGRLAATLPDGSALATSSRATITTVGAPHRVTVAVLAHRGPDSAIGEVGSRLSPTASSGSGRLVLRARGRSLTLRAIGAGASATGAPTAVAVKLVVGSSTGLRTCRTGSPATLRVVDHDALTRAGHTHDSIRLTLPSGCGGFRLGYTDGNGSATSVRVGFR